MKNVLMICATALLLASCAHRHCCHKGCGKSSHQCSSCADCKCGDKKDGKDCGCEEAKQPEKKS